jgi:enolase-phosphatase E1
VRPDPDADTIRGVLLDVEGTTTSITFVYETLFPYAQARMRDFLNREIESPATRSDIEALGRERSEDLSRGASPPNWEDADPAGSAAAYTLWLMSQDRKSTPLKSIQGRIWKHGYINGEIESHVFEDVRPALERWTSRGIDVRIFSSGSVLAQKLIFGHSSAGDLTRFISGYFDTTTGNKNEAKSYARIARASGHESTRMLFVSDSLEELRAARHAEYQVLASIRPGNSPLADSSFESIRSFDEIDSRV